MRTCSFEGCERRHASRGVCASHAWQRDAGQELRPIKRCEKNRICSVEGCEKPHYGKNYCESHYAGLESSKRLFRANSLKHKYGITLEEYEVMLKGQNGVCLICESPPKEGERLYIDHDHSCCPKAKTCGKCLRGLLCKNCNSAIGLLKDSPEHAKRAMNYLNNFRLYKADDD